MIVRRVRVAHKEVHRLEQQCRQHLFDVCQVGGLQRNGLRPERDEGLTDSILSDELKPRMRQAFPGQQEQIEKHERHLHGDQI
jgi:hypothetical protein